MSYIGIQKPIIIVVELEGIFWQSRGQFMTYTNVKGYVRFRKIFVGLSEVSCKPVFYRPEFQKNTLHHL